MKRDQELEDQLEKDRFGGEQDGDPRKETLQNEEDDEDVQPKDANNMV
jgi:hypothetical protein